MAKATSEQAQELEHAKNGSGTAMNGPATPAIAPPGRKLTREEALDRTFEKNKELYERLAQ